MGKRPIYAREGVGHLWLIEPVDRTLEAFELREGQWVLIACAKDDEAVSVRPFNTPLAIYGGSHENSRTNSPEERPMSWIKARAYSDASFVRDRLLDQLEADIGEANRLPPTARSELTFGMKRDERKAVISIAFTDSEEDDAVRIAVMEGTVIAVLLEPGGKVRKIRITARWDAGSDQEQWFIDGGETPLTIAALSRAILEPTLFA